MDKGIATDGSNLSGVSAKCAWVDLSRPPEDEEDSRSIYLEMHPRRLSDKGNFCGSIMITKCKIVFCWVIQQDLVAIILFSPHFLQIRKNPGSLRNFASSFSVFVY